MSDASTASDQQQSNDQQQSSDQQQSGDQQQDLQQQDAGLLGRDQQQQDSQQQDGPAEWLSTLPDELKGDATLARFKSVEDLARGHVEAHKVAKSKVVLPKDDDPESFARFAASVRPESADAYEIEVPEGQGTEFADAMRPVFHEAGLLPQQAAKLVEANNKFAAQAMEAANAKGQEELDALQAEMGAGEFERGKQAAVNMLNKLGVDPKFEEDMSRFLGTGNTLRTLFAIAEKTGELGRVTADDVSLAMGGLKGDAAMNAAREMQKDPDTAKKLTDPSSAERKHYDQLVAAAAKKGA